MPRLVPLVGAGRGPWLDCYPSSQVGLEDLAEPQEQEQKRWRRLDFKRIKTMQQ